MQEIAWYYNRLRSMDLYEILWRLKSMLVGQIDILRSLLGWLPTLTVNHGLTRSTYLPGFTCAPPKTEPGSRHIGESGSGAEKLLRDANLILENKLSFFDLKDQHLGNPIDWHRDHSSNRRGPIKHITRTNYRDFDQYGDCKLVWEPNRHHQLVVLARAYYASGDTRFAAKIQILMSDWISSNRFLYGMNWKSPLELGIRLINWIWAIDLIRSADVFDDDQAASILDCIYKMSWEVSRKYSRGSSANNHLIGEAAGVFVSASYFPEMPGSKRRIAESQLILEQEIIAQTFPDGCTREHAFNYQIFVIQFFTICKIVSARTDNPFTPEFNSRLHQMYMFMASLCRDSGHPPNAGDADNGYVLNLGELPDSPAELISVGADLFDDPSLRLADSSQTSWWFFGDLPHPSQADASDNASQAFPDSGYFILRGKSVEAGNAISVFLDCAELGYGPIAAHGHADCLSFTLSVDNIELLVDPGTYDYFSFPMWRNYFRRTEAHNTLTVDNLCQSESLGPFMWGNRANANLLKWQDSPSHTIVEGEHDGYTRLNDPVVHRRALTLNKAEGSLDIIDHISCRTTHVVRQYFHVAPESKLTNQSDVSVRINKDGSSIELATESGTLEVESADDEKQLGWISSGYHVRKPSNCIVITKKIDSSAELITRIRCVA